jgi:hypothetical protein
MVIWYILWLFGTFYGYLVHFSRFGMLYQEKSGNPDVVADRRIEKRLQSICPKPWLFVRKRLFFV